MPQSIEPIRLTLSTPPAKLPVTMDEVRAHLRIDATDIDEEAPMAADLRAATNQAELYLSQSLITQTWTLFRDSWPTTARSKGDAWWDGVRQGAISSLFSGGREMELPKWPLISVTHIKTYDDDDTATTFAASKYFVDTTSRPGRIVLREAAAAPAPTRVANGVEVQYVAGYGPDYADVPEDIRQGILRMIAYLYENRGECSEDQAMDKSGAAVLWARHRILRV